MKSANINIFFSHIIIDSLSRYNVNHFFISPGSRSTPLVTAAARRPEMSIKIHADERGSAYMAVGFARASGPIPAVICTSGTALGNLFPAVIEAFQSRLPLVLLTADRPEELQNCGANQTINQSGIFGRFAVSSITIGAFDDSTDPQTILSAIHNAIQKLPEGPIHINCRFREPLAPIKSAFDHESLTARVEKYYRERPPTETGSSKKISSSEFDQLVSLIDSHSSGIIIAGPEAPFRKCQSLSKLANRLNWPLLADIHSQHRFNTDSNNSISHHDLFLDHNIPGLPTPDVIIHVGGLPTSKRLNNYLFGLKGIEYIKIQDHHKTIDPDRLETMRLIGDPDDIIAKLLPRLKQNEDSHLFDNWRKVDYICIDFLSKRCKDGHLSEPSLAYSIGKFMSAKDAFYISSSMPIRNAESFVTSRPDNIIVGANRGASGIDGVIASACGFALGSHRPTTLLIGDLAVIHDLSSLALVKALEVPVIIVIVNNRGGGIFHFLPISDFDDIFEPYFGTPHELNFEAAAKMFDLPYYHPITLEEFESSYKKARATRKSAIIEIITNREENVTEHEAIRQQLGKKLSNANFKA